MPSPDLPEDPSLHLAPGTQLGPWRIVERQGYDAYGVLYRAVRAGTEPPEFGALKLARHPLDPRFAREAQALSRLSDPSIPRLLHGEFWRTADGAAHPFLVTEWVDGTPLYDWAQQHRPTSEHYWVRDKAPPAEPLLVLLAQVARALAATHAAGVLHRNVTGATILVRHSDGRAMLTGFGSALLSGSTRVPYQSLERRFDPYLSPEAKLFVLRSNRTDTDGFQATQAEDLYSLGVTAFRVVAGEYPPWPEPVHIGNGEYGRMAREDPRAILEYYGLREPRLLASIFVLLSIKPWQRGTAEELIRTLESPWIVPPRSRAAPSKQAPHRPSPPSIPSGRFAPRFRRGGA